MWNLNFHYFYKNPSIIFSWVIWMQSTHCNLLKHLGNICFKNIRRNCWILRRSCYFLLRVCVCVCLFVCIYTNKHTHTHTHTHVHILKSYCWKKAHQSTWKMKVSSNHIKAIISGIPLCFTRDVTALLVWLYDMSNEYVKKGQSLQKTTGMRHVEWTKEIKEENCNQRASSQIAVLHVTKKSFRNLPSA